MARKSKLQNISHQEIENAVQEFLGSGGEIKQLPEQKVFVPKTIGAGKWDFYENISDFSV